MTAVVLNTPRLEGLKGSIEPPGEPAPTSGDDSGYQGKHFRQAGQHFRPELSEAVPSIPAVVGQASINEWRDTELWPSQDPWDVQPTTELRPTLSQLNREFDALLRSAPTVVWREPALEPEIGRNFRVPHSMYVGVGMALAGVTVSSIVTASAPTASVAAPVALRQQSATASRSAAPLLEIATSTTLRVTTTQAPLPTTTTTAATAPPSTTSTTATIKAVPRTTTTVKKAPAPIAAAGKNCSANRAAAEACWGGLIRQYGWNYQTAFNIMMCESGGNPNARNPHSTATGLFQILSGPTDPAANVALAYSMYQKRGWQPWVCKG